ncbi:hypothetical protein Holit_02387 [Hollandina sp. SP2]
MRMHQEMEVRRATGTEQDEARLVGKRMREWEEGYFRFIGEGIEATNNPAELAIRQIVLGRKVTQGAGGSQAMSGMSGFGVYIPHAVCKIYQ